MPTLIESIIVTVLAGILLIVGVSSWHVFKARQQIAYITHSIQQSLYFSREQAVLRNQEITIIPIHNAWKNGWTIQLDRSSKALFQIGEMPFPIKYKGFQKNTQIIKVFPNSTTMGYQGRFEYGDQILILNQGGRARVEH